MPLRDNCLERNHSDCSIASVLSLVDTMPQPVRLNGRDLKLHKATVSPELGTRTVLTNSPWDFVALWLQRNGKSDALFFWNQARVFADASRGMPVESSPLLHYYGFMNATKALLAAKAVTFDAHHGVSGHNMRGSSTVIDLSNEGIKIQNRGVLSALSSYLGERELDTLHSLEELLFNIPCIHRTVCLTYPGQEDRMRSINRTPCAKPPNGMGFRDVMNSRLISRLASQ
jgi:hypothetical protein